MMGAEGGVILSNKYLIVITFNKLILLLYIHRELR